MCRDNRRLCVVLGLIVVTLSFGRAEAVEILSGDFTLKLEGELRSRWFYLRNGTSVRMLDPEVRIALHSQGTEKITEEMSYGDLRFRLGTDLAYRNIFRIVSRFEVGDIVYGVKSSGGGIGTDVTNIETKNLYLEITLGTSWLLTRLGLQTMSLPGGYVLSQDVAGGLAEFRIAPISATVYAAFVKLVDNSRLDLDADGVINNNYADRDMFYGGYKTDIIPHVQLDVYFAADIDSTEALDLETRLRTNSFWVGANVLVYYKFFQTEIDFVYNFGSEEFEAMEQDFPIRAWTFHQRVLFDLRYLEVELLFGYATADEPDTNDTERFRSVSPEFQMSNILYDTVGGLSLTGGDLSGTIYGALRLRGSPVAGLTIDATFLYAAFTESPATFDNVFVRDVENRRIGFEMDYNFAYRPYRWLQLYLKTGFLFPEEGLQAAFDSPTTGLIAEVMAGIQASF